MALGAVLKFEKSNVTLPCETTHGKMYLTSREERPRIGSKLALPVLMRVCMFNAQIL